jgi:predicted phage-related endonuclease
VSPLTARQSTARAHNVGASEVGALAGDYRHPYATPASIYARVVLGVAPKVGTAADLGRELEPSVLAMAGRRLGVRIRSTSWTYRHRDLPLVATADAVTLDELHGQQAIVEAKVVGPWGASDWQAGPPAHVVDQLQTQLGLSRRKLGVIAVLLGGTAFELHELPFDPVRFRILEDAVRTFVREHLEPELPPELDPDRDAELVLTLAELPAGTGVAAGAALEAARFLDVRARLRIAAEHDEAAARAQLERELVASGFDALVPPAGDAGSWRASVVERDGRRSLRFIPSRQPKDTDR